MHPSTINITKENIAETMAKKRVRHFMTKIKLFMNHNGLRRNKVHLLIAPTGVGKSTFVRTLTIDFIENNPDMKVLLWLTEETQEDFEDEFSYGLTDKVIEASENLHVVSEQSLGEDDTKEDVRKNIEEIIEYENYDLVILDNLTTSKLYTGVTATDQEKAALWLKGLCKRDLALFVIAHAGAGAYDGKLIDETDIRGNKTLPNLVEFLYILQPFHLGNRLFQFLITKKHRGQPIHSKYIGIKYDKETNTFKESDYVDFNSLKEIFNKRNKL
jgi:KaiC/GvpD/RAD55 family RecA-like ATPase